jgi:hypothetical protein
MNVLKRATQIVTTAGALSAPLATFAADTAQCTGAKAAGITDCTDGTINTKIDAFINTAFFIAGTLAVIVIIVAGIMYIQSTGDSKRIEQAKNTLFYAVAGLIVVILARLAVGFIIGRLA